jgi:Tfp pilus assembly protein PilE
MFGLVPKGPLSRGFSLVELMNFLALAALLATLGMYGLARYVRHAKTAEAVGNVTAITQAAAAFYNESDAHQPAGTKPEQAKAMRHFPTPARQTVPADVASVRGKKYQSAIGDWSVSPWPDLAFKINQPQCYAYNFESTGSGSTATATATANGDLDGNGMVSTYRSKVAPDDKLEAAVSPTIERSDPEE